MSDGPSLTQGDIDDVVASIVLDILVTSGPDAVHLSEVAASAGCPVEEFTSRYGHVGELLYVAWDKSLRLEFASIVAQARDLMSGDFTSIRGGKTVSSRRRAAVHLVSVAHRFDELKEAVPFDVQHMLLTHETGCHDDSDRSVMRGLIGWLCGILLDPGRNPDETLSLLLDTNWHDNCWRKAEQGEYFAETPELPLVFEDVSEMLQKILLACTRIVAEGGVGRATLVRIARSVGYSPTDVYTLFGRQEHLLAQYVQFVFGTLFSYSRLSELLQDASHADMRVRVWLGPRVQIRRRALLECVLASQFSPFLKTAYQDALDEGLADVQVANLRATPAHELNTYRRFIASRQIVLGLAALEEVELATWPRTWRPFLAAFLSDHN